MIKIIKEGKDVPRKQVTCGNCDSVLEYGNDDLYEDYSNSPYTITRNPYGFIGGNWYLTCPICRCRVYTGWITPTKKSEDTSAE